jgi:hypothetical protein
MALMKQQKANIIDAITSIILEVYSTVSERKFCDLGMKYYCYNPGL